MQKRFFLMWNFVGFCLASCSTSGAPKPIFEQKFPVIYINQVPDVQINRSKIAKFASRPKIELTAIEDTRTDLVIMRHKEAEITTASDLKLVIKFSLSKTMKQMGLEVTPNAPLKLNLKISNVSMRVENEKLASDVVMYVVLKNIEGEEKFSSVIEGRASLDSPNLLERDLAKVLGMAIANSLKELLESQELHSVLF